MLILRQQRRSAFCLKALPKLGNLHCFTLCWYSILFLAHIIMNMTYEIIAATLWWCVMFMLLWRRNYDPLKIEMVCRCCLLFKCDITHNAICFTIVSCDTMRCDVIVRLGIRSVEMIRHFRVESNLSSFVSHHYIITTNHHLYTLSKSYINIKIQKVQKTKM